MERQPVTSSNIASIGHDPETNTLHVEFNSGRVYEYAGVDASQHRDLIDAPSIGAHFHKHIRSVYDGKPVH